MYVLLTRGKKPKPLTGKYSSSPDVPDKVRGERSAPASYSALVGGTNGHAGHAQDVTSIRVEAVNIPCSKSHGLTVETWRLILDYNRLHHSLMVHV